MIMKKRICQGMLMLLIVGAMLAGCASVPVPIDLPSLKGKWVGRTIFGNLESAAGGETQTELEIYGETLPIEGRIAFLALPSRIWNDLSPGIQSGPTGQGAVVPFKNGRLSDKGSLVLTSGDNSLTLHLYNDGGKLKLVGTIVLQPAVSGKPIIKPLIQGDVSLTKNKE